MHSMRLKVMVLTWSLLAVIVFGWNLGASAIPDWDEGTHAIVTREMLASGDWLNLTFLEVDYFRKPPLSFWIRGLTEVVFGESEFSVRFPSALAGVLTAGILGLWVWQARRSLFAVHVTLTVFLTSSFTMYHTFRSGESDGLLGLFIAAAFYFGWRSLTQPRLLVLAALATGLAVMTKSAGGFIPVFVIAAALAWLRKWPYRPGHLWTALIVFVAVVAPWHIYQSVFHGTHFWGEYLGTHVLSRVGEELPGNDKLHGFFGYVPIFFRDLFPWAFFLPAAFVQLLRRSSDASRDQAVIVLVCGVIVPFVLYSAAATKLSWYLLPAWVSAGALVGLAADDLRRRSLTPWTKILLVTGGILAYAWLPWFLPAGEFRPGSLTDISARVLTFKKTILVLSLGLMVVMMRVWKRSMQFNVFTRITLVVFFHLVMIAGTLTFHRLQGAYESAYRVLSEAQVASAEPIMTYALGFDNVSFNKSVRYYFHAPPARSLRVIETMGEINSGSHGYILTKRQIEMPLEFSFILVRKSHDLMLYRF